MKIVKVNKLFVLACAMSQTIAPTVCAEEQEAIEQLEPVVIYGTGIKHSSAKNIHPTTTLTGDDLRRKVGQTLGETLQNELGVTNQSYGAGVGIPIIRGQTGSRVKIMQNSLGNNDLSALSPDHATGVDPIIAERVEILRGPSTLLYGSGIIGGIVNIIDNRIPEEIPEKPISGTGEQRYDSATTESASSLKLDAGKNHFAFHTDGFYRDQDTTHIGGFAINENAVRQYDPSFSTVPPNTLINTKGFISNSQARSRGGSVGGSYITDDGMIGAAVNKLDKVYGIPPDGRGEPPVTVNLKQSKYDFKTQVNNPFAFAEEIRLKFGYTDYQHAELNGGSADTMFSNESFESRLELAHKPLDHLNGVTGFQSVNTTFEATGTESQIVPKSNIESYALFSVESLKFDAVTVDLGMRMELNNLTPVQLYKPKSYVPISGSASVLWDITDQHQVSVAFTHSERAPQIQELFWNGMHHATRSYERGNFNLKKELSNNLDLRYQYNNDWVQAEFNLFHNWVNNYIYQQRSSAELYDAEKDTFLISGMDCGECFPVLNSQQATAVFKGFEAQTTFPLLQNQYGLVDLTLFGDYTRGTFSNDSDVPRMPPLRYGLQLSYEKNEWSAHTRLTRAEAQTHPGDNEAPTGSYLLLNITGEYHVEDLYGADMLIFAKGKNLLNENIRNSTSYLRNFAPEPGISAEIGIRIRY